MFMVNSKKLDDGFTAALACGRITTIIDESLKAFTAIGLGSAFFATILQSVGITRMAVEFALRQITPAL